MSEQVNTPAPAAAPETIESATSENIETPIETAEEAPEASASAEKTPAAVKKEEAKIAKKLKQLKLKVDGKEFDEDLPFEIEEGSEAEKYMKQQLQLAKAAQKRMSEASDLKKKLDQVGEYLQQAKGNPAKIRQLMKELEVDEKALAAMIVEEEIERAKKSPEQLEKEAMQQELQRMKEEREKEKKELEAREYERLVGQEAERYDLMFTKAFEQNKIPKNPFFVKRTAEYMNRAISKGLEVSIDEIIPFVHQEIKDDLKQMFSASPEDFIEELLGKDNIKRLQKNRLDKAKVIPPVPLNKSVVDTGEKKGKKAQEESKMSMRDYFKKL